MKRELNKLYEYCKSKGYNESIEKFEEDLSQLMVEELESEELSKVSGGKKGINALTAGVISALSIASPLVSAAGASGFNSGVGKTTGALPPAATVKVVNKAAYNKATPKSSDSKDTLKNILIGVLGLGVTGAVAGDIGLGVALAKANKNKPKPEPVVQVVKEVGDLKEFRLKVAEVLSELLESSWNNLEEDFDNLSKDEKNEIFSKTFNWKSNMCLNNLDKTLMGLPVDEDTSNDEAILRDVILEGVFKGKSVETIMEEFSKRSNKRVYLVCCSNIMLKWIVLFSNEDLKKSFMEKYKNWVKDITEKIDEEKVKATNSGELFYNTINQVRTDVEFKMFLDACAELLKDCPDQNGSKPIISMPKQLDDIEKVLELIKEKMDKETDISVEGMATYLKEQEFIQNLKDRITLGNSSADSDDQQVEQNEQDEQLKWNYVGALMSIAIGQNGDPADDRNDANWYYITKKIPNAGGLISQCISCINSAKQTEESEQQSVSINWPVAAEPTEVQLSIRDDGTSHSGDEESKSDDDSATTETSSEE